MSNPEIIVQQFKIVGEIQEILPFGSGHIHDTFRVKTAAEKSHEYILQRVNTSIFKDYRLLMRNIRLITDHIKNELLRSTDDDQGRKVLSLTPLKDGSDFFVDEQSHVWRLFNYIADHQSYDKAANESLVYEGGRAYGHFLSILEGLPANKIGETIEDFHNIDLRLQQFENSLISGNTERMKIASREIEMIEERKLEMRTIRELGLKGLIPLRLVHHDTKINNVLFDADGNALCVIDLDTVMPGYVHDDFGDAIRTFTNTGEEDDAELDHISMNLVYFKAFARGYLEAAGSLLTPVEKDYLALSGRVMTYMQSVRFLTDYLNSDIYYKIHHPEHNIQRTRAQLKLLESMEFQYPQMCDIIHSLK